MHHVPFLTARYRGPFLSYALLTAPHAEPLALGVALIAQRPACAILRLEKLFASLAGDSYNRHSHPLSGDLIEYLSIKFRQGFEIVDCGLRHILPGFFFLDFHRLRDRSQFPHTA